MYTSRSELRKKQPHVQLEYYTTEILHPLIILGKCFALFPVNISKSKNINSFKFKWLSFKMLYTAIVFLSALTVASMCFGNILLRGATLNKAGKCNMKYNSNNQSHAKLITVDAGFYTNAAITVVLFTVLAKEWSTLMDVWIQIDKNMNRVYGFPAHLHRKLKYTIIVFMLLAVGKQKYLNVKLDVVIGLSI